MRRLAPQNTGENDSEVNLTPMLDVVFIMLIFFIVTATFVKEIGLDVNQPDEDQPETVNPDKASIQIQISARDIIEIGGRELDVRSIRANIERLHAQNPEAPVVIIPNRHATTNAIIGVMDAAQQANVYNIQISGAVDDFGKKIGRN